MSKINHSTENLEWQAERTGFRAPTKRRRVLLIGKGNAFSDGVMNLLSRCPNLSVSRTSHTQEAAILGQVTQHRPEVLVLIQSRAMDLDNILILLSATQAASHLRLVVLSLENTGIEIHEVRNAIKEIQSSHIFPATVEDFLRVVNKDWHALPQHPEQ